MTPNIILSQSHNFVKEKDVATVFGTVRLDVNSKKSNWKQIDEIGIDMKNLILRLNNDSMSVLKIYSHIINKFDSRYGTILYNVELLLNCEKNEALVAANYYLNELNIDMEKHFVGLVNGNCVIFDVDAIWIEWTEATCK